MEQPLTSLVPVIPYTVMPLNNCSFISLSFLSKTSHVIGKTKHSIVKKLLTVTVGNPSKNDQMIKLHHINNSTCFYLFMCRIYQISPV